MVCQLLFFSFLRWCGYTNLAGSLHLELVHGLAGLGNIDAVVLLRHILFSFSFFATAKNWQRRLGREPLRTFSVLPWSGILFPALVAPIAFADRR